MQIVIERRSDPDEGETGHGTEDAEEGEEEHHEDHSALIDSLFENYDSTSSPTHGTHTPTVISVNLQLLSLDDISDTKMEFVIDARVTFFWNDARLMTPECRDEEKDCDDHFDIKRRMNDLWTPDLYIINSRLAKQHEQHFWNGMVYLMATGKILLSKRLTLTLRCPMDLALYPLDTQRYHLLICPYSLTDQELVLRWTKNGVGLMDAEQQGHNKFVLQLPIKIGNKKLQYEGPDVSGFFSCVNATFTRHNGYHMGYSYTITSFIVVVCWIAFWLPVTAFPARITLGVTPLLTLLTTANYVRSSVPPISYVTAVDVWVGLWTMSVLLAFLLFPVSHYCSAMNPNKSNKTTAINVKSRIDLLNEKCGACGGKKSISHFHDSKSVDVDRICRQLFPLLFIIFNIVYWWYDLRAKAELSKNG